MCYCWWLWWIDDERAGTTAFSEVWEVAEEECADEYAEGTSLFALPPLRSFPMPSPISRPSSRVCSSHPRNTRSKKETDAHIVGKEIL
jgi:hypothetical protein